MGDWLIGVYKGKFITATDSERDGIWAYNAAIRRAGLFKTCLQRLNLRPYFYILEAIPETSAKSVCGDSTLPKKYGLEPSAWKYSGIPPIPAKGAVDESYTCPKLSRFYLDGTTAAKYEKEHGLKLAEALPGRICALALNAKGRHVRTGTLFTAMELDGKIWFQPCIRGKKNPGDENRTYLICKGILLGISSDKEAGTMSREQAKGEMKGPASTLCVGFRHEGNKFFIVYREATTDLRADMPIAMLKVSRMGRAALEGLFRKLGESVKAAFQKKTLVPFFGRDTLLDGTIVDYEDAEEGVDISKNPEFLRHMHEELCSMLLEAALIATDGVRVFPALRDGKKGLIQYLTGGSHARTLEMLNAAALLSTGGEGLLAGKELETIICNQEILRRYSLFLARFSEGAGKQVTRAYFRELEGAAGLLRFFEPGDFL